MHGSGKRRCEIMIRGGGGGGGEGGGGGGGCKIEGWSDSQSPTTQAVCEVVM